MTRGFLGLVRRWRACCVGLACTLGSGVAVGCSALSDPPMESRYVLASIAGVALPAPFDVTRDTEGNVWTLEMVESRLTLLPDNTFQRTLSALRKLNGEVLESLQVNSSGSVERRGHVLIVRYPSGGGYDDVVQYEVIEGGRQLAGPHSTGAVYRWLREDAAR